MVTVKHESGLEKTVAPEVAEALLARTDSKWEKVSEDDAPAPKKAQKKRGVTAKADKNEKTDKG